MTVLVTGGAGYIGSHVVRLLEESGTKVLAVDDLSTGLKSRLLRTKLLNLDLADAAAVSALTEAMKQDSVNAVIHLAALKQVGESVLEPEKYFQKNLGGQANLLIAMKQSGVSKLVFSSSAAAYGMPDKDSVSEIELAEPINPYGQTKLIGEWMAQNAERAWGLKQVSLRYFNVAGAGWPDLADSQKLNLIPIVFDAITSGTNPQVFGDNYNTPDGSCIRDYVHVQDLAEAHLSALSYLDQKERPFDLFNVGTGIGYSVFEVLEEVKRQTGKQFEIEVTPPRAGDPPRLTADVSRIQKIMNWKATRDLSEMIKSAWEALATKD